MSTSRMVLYLLIVFGAYAFVGRTDYEEAVRMANAYTEGRPLLRTAPFTVDVQQEQVEQSPITAAVAPGRFADPCGIRRH